MAAVFSEDVEEFASEACLPRFNKALGVNNKSAFLPVFMTSHHILRSYSGEGGKKAIMYFRSAENATTAG